MTLQQFVAENAEALRAHAARRLRPLHRPGDDPVHQSLQTLLRPPLGPQADLITAAVKALARQKDVTLATEMSTGKTYLALGICHARAARRVLIACPPHLVQKWAREIEATLPSAVVTVRTGGKAWLEFATELNDASARQIYFDTGPKAVHRAQPRTDAADGRQFIPKHSCRSDRSSQTAYRRDRGGPHFTIAPITSLKLLRGGVSPARLLGKRKKGYYDILVLDESHQLKSGTTRAGKAAQHLIAAAKKVVLLTGTLTAGRADDLFPTLFRLIPGRLKALGYGSQDARRFGEHYGRVEASVRTTPRPGGRGHRTLRRTTVRPGLMPGLFGDLLADRVLFLSLRDLGVCLPVHDEQAVGLALSPGQATAYASLAAAVVAAFSDLSRRSPKAALQFLAPATELLLTWPDDPSGWPALRAEWRTVILPQDVGGPLPKEDRLYGDVEAEVKAGRQVWVFTTRDRVRERLARVLAPFQPLCLTADVPPGEREAWIRRHGPGAQVILSHPQLVETGLELFGPGYNFCSLFWVNVGTRPDVLRQASARHWRIGQTRPCKTRYYYYERTAQEPALALMGQKVAAAKFLEGRTDASAIVEEAADGRFDLALLRLLAEALLKSAA